MKSRPPLAPASELVPADEPTSRSVLAILGGQHLRGNWEPPGQLRVITIMGGVTLDFRDADLLEGVTEIHIIALMGGVEIKAPADVHVDMWGAGVLGGFPSFQRTAPDPGAPTLRIRGTAIMGGAGVKVT